MAVKIKSQKDYFVTEAVIELPTDPSELDDLLRSMGTTGKMNIQYNQGGVLGITIEQRTKILESHSDQIRDLLGIATKKF